MSRKNTRVDKIAIITEDASALALIQYCPDLENWPHSWRYEERDIIAGKRIVDFFKPFLLHLLTQKLTAKTLHRRRDHLWMLGGEVIRRRQEDSTLSRLAVEKVTFALLEEDGGPLIWPRISEQEQNAFDTTCRKFYRYLTTATNPSE